MEGFDKFGGSDVQSVGQFHDVEQADVPLSALDPTYVIAVQLRQLGELLLREIAFHPQLADTPSEYDSRAGIRHLAILRT